MTARSLYTAGLCFAFVSFVAILGVKTDKLSRSTIVNSPGKVAPARMYRNTRKTTIQSQSQQKRKIPQLYAMNMGPLPATIMVLQSIGLVGASVTGYLARRRRDEIHALNDQLRTINSELREREAKLIEKEAVLNYLEKKEMEKAAEETEDRLSADERSASALISEGREDMQNGMVDEAITKLKLAIETSDNLENLRYAINARRALSSAYMKKSNLNEALSELLAALKISEKSEELIHSKVALCGDIADVYTDMGELRKAAEYYDAWIANM